MKLPPWSYTMLDTAETCPSQAFHKFILKEREPESAVSRHGTDVHKALEHYVRDGAPLGVYDRHEPLARSMRGMAGAPGIQTFTEVKLGVRPNLTSCDFFAGDVWGRGVVDVALLSQVAGFIGDWKTGKKREKALQTTVFALMIFAKFPALERLTACNLWLTDNTIGEIRKFKREDTPTYWTTVVQKVEALEKLAAKDEPWPARPNGLCREWCSVLSCPHNGRH